MTTKERLYKFLEHIRVVPAIFEKQCGLSNGFCSKVGYQLSQKSIELISKQYPDLNIVWLVHGKGEMLLSREEEVISLTSGVPYYNVDFIGGFDLMTNDQTQTPEYYINFADYNRATCWCNVTGHSMEPEINHGDIIALRRIEDTSFIPYGEVYAIVASNGMRTIKRIGPSENKNCYSLIPTNKSPEYGIQEIEKDKIIMMYLVLGCMKRL